MSDDKKKKKMLMRIDKSPELQSVNGYNPSFSNGLSFALVGPKLVEEKGGKRLRYQITDAATCRDSLCNRPRCFLQKKIGQSWVEKMKENTMDFDRFRLMMITAKSADKSKIGLFAAKRALNILEKHAGWTPSIISTVKYRKDTNASAFLLTGDPRWMQAPHLISLVALLMRVGFKGADLSATTVKELVEKFKNCSGIDGTDSSYIKNIGQFVPTLLKNINKVYPGSPDQYYPYDTQKGFRGNGGVYQLLYYKDTGNKELDKRVKEFVLNK